MKTRTAAHSWFDLINSLFFVFPSNIWCKINKLLKYYEYQLTKRCLEGRLEGFKVSSWFLKIMKVVEHRIAKIFIDCNCIRYIRSNYPLLPFTGNSHWLNFDASCQVMFPTSHSRYSVPSWIEDVNCLDLLAQELGFVLKSEQREGLELLLRGKDVFCVLPTGFGKRLIYQMFVHAKSSSSSVQRPTVNVMSPA